MNTKIIVGILIAAVIGLGGWYALSKRTAHAPSANPVTNTSNTDNTNTSPNTEEFSVDGKKVSREEFGNILASFKLDVVPVEMGVNSQADANPGSQFARYDAQSSTGQPYTYMVVTGGVTKHSLNKK